VTDEVVNEEVKDETESAQTEAAETPEPEGEEAAEPKRGGAPTRVLAYAVLPALVLLLALGAGFLKWVNTTARDVTIARDESVRTASDSTVAMLSYKADTVDKDLGAARDRMTGQFKESYDALTHDVVIPGAKEKHISASASVPAVASVSATENHAVVLVFVNQIVTMGADPPTNTASSVRVTLDKIAGRWLISDFTPV
jgi:Mce-associated membrane protein